MKAIVKNQYFWGIIALVLLIMVDVIKDPSFIQITVSNGNLYGSLIDILRGSAPVLMIAIGMTLVIATAGIDLSVGSLMAVAGAVSMEFLASAANSGSTGAVLTALGLSLLVTVILGAINGLLVSVVGLQPFITTLIMMMTGRGIAKVITGGQNTSARSDGFAWISTGTVFGFPVAFVIAIAIVALVALVVRRSALGMTIESVGINQRASRMAGIKPLYILFSVYVISGLLAGMAGVFATANVMTVEVSKTGMDMEMDAILAVVIGGISLAGGRFSLGGSAIGALLITTLNRTVTFLNVPSAATPAFKAAVIIIVCLLQSERVRNLFKTLKRSRRVVEAAPARVEEVKEVVAA
ncbi:ABC transporter permease [Propionibacterium freudenreichii]|uniref:ABC transporter permease n=1 Tax=Propionibacterium freudenreichii TaxID=1744 RepID=UPI0038529036